MYSPQSDYGYRWTTTDRSGTIAIGGTSQAAALANNNRSWLWIQNPSANAESLFVNFTLPASPTLGNSIELAPGEHIEMRVPGFITTEQINVNALSAGHAYIYKEA